MIDLLIGAVLERRQWRLVTVVDFPWVDADSKVAEERAYHPIPIAMIPAIRRGAGIAAGRTAAQGSRRILRSLLPMVGGSLARESAATGPIGDEARQGC